MRTSKHFTATTALALALSLGLAACGDDEPEVETPVEEPGASAAETSEDTPTEAGNDAQETTPEGGVGGATTDDQSATEEDTGQGSGGSDDTGASSADAGDLTAIALTAIATAEAEAGGEAYEIDDQDRDGTWEVDVRVGDGSVEVTVSAEGTEVVRTREETLDREDGDALDEATITLTEAIELAIDEVGGVLDDAELEGPDDGQPAHWEVSVDLDGPEDDIDVLIGLDGTVLGTDS